MQDRRNFVFWCSLALLGIGVTIAEIQTFILGLIFILVGTGGIIWWGWPRLMKRLNRLFYWLAGVLVREDVPNLLKVEIQPHWGEVGGKRSLDFALDVFNGSLEEVQLEEKVAGIMGFSTSNLPPAPLPTAPIVEVTEGRAGRGKIARLRIRQPLEQTEAEGIEQSLSDGQDVTVNFKAGKKHHRLPLPGTISFRQSLRVTGWGGYSSYSPLKAARGN